MFGLKEDWSLEVPPRYQTLEDYDGGVARWCPGCGDHSILTVVQRLCRDEQLAPERTVFVSGIGCSSRFPHYMKTYGFHGLHGRALPVACGVKSRRPDLAVFVVTGDGDCCSIGAGHWVHAVRYNMDMVVMLLDNSIYGLTKKQTSPTTPQGLPTSTHPHGALLPPLNVLTATLGFANCSFLAQTVDWSPAHLYATLQQAFRHRGLSFVRIVQRCPVFVPQLYAEAAKDPNSALLLSHSDGIALEDRAAAVFPHHLDHDPSDLAAARQIAEQSERIPIGLLYRDATCPVYDDYTTRGVGTTTQDKLNALEREFERFAI